MTTELTMLSSKASGALMPSRLGPVLESISRGSPIRLAMRGPVLRLYSRLTYTDDAAVSVLLAFDNHGARMTASAHGPSSALVAWAFHAIADALHCEVDDGTTKGPRPPSPERYEDRARSYLNAYEEDVARDRREVPKPEAAEAPAEDPTAATKGFLTWLAKEERIALVGDAADLVASLPMGDVEAAYEMLLEHDDVDDVFMSESEFRGLYSRWTARKPR
ncbi:MAG: hypothetical protein U0169_06720 [Polyangiaceae bacterium]